MDTETKLEVLRESIADAGELLYTIELLENNNCSFEKDDLIKAVGNAIYENTDVYYDVDYNFIVKDVIEELPFKTDIKNRIFLLNYVSDNDKDYVEFNLQQEYDNEKLSKSDVEYCIKQGYEIYTDN